MKNVLILLGFFLAVTACNTAQKCIENPKPDCICTMQYDPVCGCNNKTYGNACAAQCAGIKTFTKGECKQSPSQMSLEGKTWKLSRLADGAQPDQVPDNVNIIIKFESGKIEGNGGCNKVGGAYTATGNNLTVSGLFSTKMFCEGSSPWESRFLKSLEKSQSYTINNETLQINCGDLGTLTFRPQ